MIKGIFFLILSIFTFTEIAFANGEKVKIHTQMSLYAMPGGDEFLYDLKPGSDCNKMGVQGDYIIVSCLEEDKHRQVGFIENREDSIQIVARK